ncbi:hypothetical protein M2140_000884 [Clostridiales Family XIII bacterium PM5-7]
MDQLEKVEKIREKTGVTYEAAKEALDATDGDVLDAIVYLEANGKIKEPEVKVYSTKEDTASEEVKEAAKQYQTQQEDFGGLVRRFLKWCGSIIKKGCENFFIVSRYNEEIMTVPVIVLVLVLLLMFWCIFPLMIVGLFFGFKYSFRGAIAQSVDVNKACDIAADACESMKQEFKQGMNKENQNKEK